MPDVEVVITPTPDVVVEVTEEGSPPVNVTLTPPPEVVEVLVPGPAGPQGEQGPQGEPGVGGGASTWDELTGKPTTFSPSTHSPTHKGDGSDPIANASTSVAGLESAADKTKLDGIETAATQDQTAAEILTAIKTVDGSGSGLDADTLDGHDTSYFATATDLITKADLVGGVVPTSQLPALAINDTFTVASQAAMLTLTAQRGDLAVRTDFDPDRSYMLSADDPTVLANWIRVTFGDVVSVNGQTGVIVLAAADVGAAAASHIHDDRYYTETESDARYKAIGYVPDWTDITGKPSTFAPSAHASTHKGDGSDPIANATTSVAGLESPADKTKLDGIESGATADQTASEILTAIKTVDGTGSGLDADLLDGHDTGFFATASHAAQHKGDGSDPIANATTSVAGLESAADKTKLDGIETGATADQTAAEILTAIKTVDGTGSGLDADLLDGNSSAAFVLGTDYEDADVLAKIKNVDGAGSGLDADLLDGHDTAYFATATSVSDHLADTVDAHDAASISYAGTAGTTADDLEEAVDELFANKANGLLNVVEVDLGSVPRRSGHFDITTTGLTAGQNVIIEQIVGPYSGKGTLADEAEMDQLTVTGQAISTTVIRCYWMSATYVRGNIKFAFTLVSELNTVPNATTTTPGIATTAFQETLLEGLEVKFVERASGSAQYETTANITVTPGAAWVPGLAKIVYSPTALTLPSLTPTSSTWYYLYLYESGGSPQLELSTVPPAAPYEGTARTKTGDTSRRFLRSLRAHSTGSNGFWKYEAIGDFIKYRCGWQQAPFLTYTGTVGTTAQTVSTNASVPPTSRRAYMLFSNNNSNIVSLGNLDGMDASTSSAPLGTDYAQFGTSWGDKMVELNSTQDFRIASNSAIGTQLVYTLGYVEER